METKHAIEHYVRRKNPVYRRWRAEHTFKELDNICSEMVMLFGPLPHWPQYVRAKRARDYRTSEWIEAEHRVWKAKVREWALSRGITRYPKQSAQLLKFYFAWWRFRYEERNGPITAMYGRQMG
jgi:hypothetical protein